jgi:carbon storage regulator
MRRGPREAPHPKKTQRKDKEGSAPHGRVRNATASRPLSSATSEPRADKKAQASNTGRTATPSLRRGPCQSTSYRQPLTTQRRGLHGAARYNIHIYTIIHGGIQMLVLSRRESQRIRLGDSITVTVVRVNGDKVRLGIEAPPEVRVLRDELSPHELTDQAFGPKTAPASVAI